jgi:phosphoribosyl-ATP pyrophosphohydrolase/phosphoribosyl-AMP cyclohydrolase
MASDGVRGGYDIEQTAGRARNMRRALVASGGAGEVAHFADVFEQADVDAALAASVFPFRPVAHRRPEAAIARGWIRGAAVNDEALDWQRGQGLLAAIVQDAGNGPRAHAGYMDRAALQQTRSTGRVTFYSRSRQRLWTKGETQRHRARLVSIDADCDGDALLVQARPRGPTCHLGCAELLRATPRGRCRRARRAGRARERERPRAATPLAVRRGTRRIAQKVGEEGVETALAAVAQDDDALLGEAADLVFHLLVLLRSRGLGLGLRDPPRAKNRVRALVQFASRTEQGL